MNKRDSAYTLHWLAQAQEAELHAGRLPVVDRLGREHDDDVESSTCAETDYSDSELDSPSAAAGAGLARDAPGGDEAEARPRSRAGSIASTYWRPERTDRKNLLTIVDERCAC